MFSWIWLFSAVRTKSTEVGFRIPYTDPSVILSPSYTYRSPTDFVDVIPVFVIKVKTLPDLLIDTDPELVSI